MLGSVPKFNGSIFLIKIMQDRLLQRDDDLFHCCFNEWCYKTYLQQMEQLVDQNTHEVRCIVNQLVDLSLRGKAEEIREKVVDAKLLLDRIECLAFDIVEFKKGKEK